MTLIANFGNYKMMSDVFIHMHRVILLLTMGTCIWGQSTPPYGNELPAYRFYKTAKWRKLTPTIATIVDVRALLGNPDDATDLANAAGPYPGDDDVISAVFTYSRLMPGWDVLIYLRTSCGASRDEHPRLCSIDLLPRKRTPFAQIKFPPVFIKKHVTAADAAWDEYSDGSGLRYDIYSTRTPYGGELPGDLDRISYGQQ